MTGHLELIAEKRFIFVMAQNTNTDHILQILDQIEADYPVDKGRVYLGGFSQGSLQAYGTAMRHPDRITAMAVTGIDPYRPWDAQDEPYTRQELNAAKEAVVPLCLQVGACEPFSYSPLNQWREHRFNPQPEGKKGRPDSFSHSGKIEDLDPTRITQPGRGRMDPNHPEKFRMPSTYVPKPGEDPREFMVKKTNERLLLLGCMPRNIDRCICFSDMPVDDLHRITGIYGDSEETFYYGGIRHDCVGIQNKEGMEVFRYIVTANSPHWPALTCARIGWDFLEKFRRNQETGKLEVKNE